MNSIQTEDSRFARLGTPNTVWAISSIHSNNNALTEIHDVLLDYIKPGDRIVYLGNYTGYGEDAAGTIDEMLAFRRLALARPGMSPKDFTYLRGAQEEIWQKLLQLQFAPNPTDVLLWMLGNGLSNTLYAYGLSPHDGIEACRAGTMEITRWTNAIRRAVRSYPGHDILSTHLLRAAYTSKDLDYPMLFVNAGLDHEKSLEEQGDNFWWGATFDQISLPYQPFQKVVRGYDPDHRGMKLNCVSATLDGGCGFGGSLICGGFDMAGELIEIFEA